MHIEITFEIEFTEKLVFLMISKGILIYLAILFLLLTSNYPGFVWNSTQAQQ